MAGDVKGRQSAGAAFLRALAQKKPEKAWCFSRTRPEAEQLANGLSQAGSPRTGVAWIPFQHPERLSEPGLLYRPDPMIAYDAWRRLDRAGPRAYSLCGITHTTATHAVMEALAGLITAPFQDWDAIICTSRAVRASVDFLVESQSSYLFERLGHVRVALPQLPVIPLGVHCADYAALLGAKAEARRELGLGDDSVVVLFVGRLSFHGKAHPLGMYAALESATQGRKVTLLQAGWFANQEVERAFRQDAQAICPSVNHTFVDGRDQTVLRRAWAAADIFTSLSDNVQETFGLTPIEALAAGLPVVVSDWDGYRDTIRHGIDGFRVSTLTLAPGRGVDLADRYDLNVDNYDYYCAYSSQFIAVDVEAAAEAYEALISDPGLRVRMGEAGRRRALAEYDWAVVFEQYEELWAELELRRRSAIDVVPPMSRRRRPDRPDPFEVFASYPTTVVGRQTKFRARDGVTAAAAVARLDLASTRFARAMLPSPALITIILKLASVDWICVDAVVRETSNETVMAIERALVWLTKVGVLMQGSATPRN